MYSYFDHEHYSKVRQAREDEGLTHTPHSRESSDMSLLGKTATDIETGKQYVVDRVVEHWYLGWYRVVTMVDSEGSHALKWVENISSHFDPVIESVKNFKERYSIS